MSDGAGAERRSTPDFVTRLEALSGHTAAYECVPDRGPAEAELRVAWRLILRRSADTVTRKLRSLARPCNWEFGDRERGAVRLRSRRWGDAVKIVAYVNAALSRGIVRYQKVGLVRRDGTCVPLLAQRAVDRRCGPPSRASEIDARVLEAFNAGCSEMLDRLADDRARLRELADSMQSAAEAWLYRRVRCLSERAADRHSSEVLLDRMAALRLDARAFTGSDPDDYGALLRRWRTLFGEVQGAV